MAVPEGRIPGIGCLCRRDELLPFGHVMDIVNRVASPFKKAGCQDAGQVSGAHGVHQCIHFPGEMAPQGRVAAADYLHGCTVLTDAWRRLAPISRYQCGCRGTREAAGIGEDEKPGPAAFNSVSRADTDQVVSTGMPCTVWVPVGSSSRTTSLVADAATSRRMAGKGSSGQGGGRVERSRVRVVGVFIVSFQSENVVLDKLPRFQVVGTGNQFGQPAIVHLVKQLPDAVGHAAVGFKRTPYIPAGG
jgi:hypothetical protein